jgi:NADH-quinone oxidoreductase subunit L
MLALIPLVPFAGFVVNATVGRRLPRSAAGAIACGAMLLAFILSLASVWHIVRLPPESRDMSLTLGRWITSGDFNIAAALRLDPLSSVMILVVTGIGFFIHVYSTAYMEVERESEYARYFAYLNLFAAFMLLLVLGANFLMLFVGWEGVGLCSYLLVGFWFDRQSAADAGKKAFIVNRIGDFGFLLGMLMIFVHYGTLDFDEIARAVSRMGPEAAFGTVSTITLLLFVGATGKSAQIPLYVWLPDAMEGPTPVSALIHAATMVTAGVYMIARNVALFSRAPETLAIVAVIGAATAFFAGTIGLVQNDIKRVLAYSTVSQLGYMFLAMGCGAYAAGIFHLYTHAFFKALLFLAAGSVIHALGGEQDIRHMGGLKDAIPRTFWTFLIGAIAISGVPGFAGFFSKDEILYRTFASGHVVLWVVGLLTSLLTAIYMFRLVFLVFFGERRAEGSNHHGHLHDAPPAMAVALIVLAAGSVLAGYAGLGGRFERFLEPSFASAAISEAGDSAGSELTLMGVSTVVALVGISVAFFVFLKRRQLADLLASRFSGLYRVLQNKYYVDEIYDATIVQPVRIVSEEGLWRGIDVRVVDGAVNGVAVIVAGAAQLLRRAQSGSVRTYAASLFFGVVIVLGYYLWR